MKTTLFWHVLFCLALFLSTNATVAQAQYTNQPDPQIVRAMTDYVHKLRKAENASRERVFESSPKSKQSSPKFASVDTSNLRATAAIQQIEHRAFDLLNEQRVQRNLRPLIWNEELSTVARLHSVNMARYKFFDHRGMDGKMVSDRAIDLDVTDWSGLGENIAFNKGFRLPVEVACDHWMKSPGHRENILNGNWTEAGMGAAIASDGSYYFTQVFLKH